MADLALAVLISGIATLKKSLRWPQQDLVRYTVCHVVVQVINNTVNNCSQFLLNQPCVLALPQLQLDPPKRKSLRTAGKRVFGFLCRQMLPFLITIGASLSGLYPVFTLDSLLKKGTSE